MKSILKFSEFVNENLNEESFADFNKSSGFKMDSKAKSTLKKLNVNPTKLKDAFDDYSKIMKYIDSNGKKIGTVSIPNPGSKSNPEFMYTVYDTDMYGKVLTGDGDSVFIEMVKEALDYTFGDAASEEDIDADNEEKVFAKYLKYIGAKNLDDAYLVMNLEDEDAAYTDDDFKPTGKVEGVTGSDLYLARSGTTLVQTGTIKGVKAFSVSDGSNEWFYVGKAGAKKLG